MFHLVLFWLVFTTCLLFLGSQASADPGSADAYAFGVFVLLTSVAVFVLVVLLAKYFGITDTDLSEEAETVGRKGGRGVLQRYLGFKTGRSDTLPDGNLCRLKLEIAT